MDFGIGNMVHDMFTLGVPVWERIIRAVLVYAFVVIALRLAGKREIGALNPFDLVVSSSCRTFGIIGATTLMGLNHGVQRFLFGQQRLDRLLEGEAPHSGRSNSP